MSFGGASKYVILSGIEICHLVREEICYLLRPKNVQNISFGWGQNFVIWSGIQNCQLVDRRIILFGLCHLVKHWNI